MVKFRQLKSPVALASFGAFFVPEPLGICLVLASAIWLLARVTAMTRLFSGLERQQSPLELLTRFAQSSDAISGRPAASCASVRGSANLLIASGRDQQVLMRFQYAALFVLGICFVIGIWAAVRNPSHRLQIQFIVGGNASSR